MILSSGEANGCIVIREYRCSWSATKKIEPEGNASFLDVRFTRHRTTHERSLKSMAIAAACYTRVFGASS